MAPWAKLNTPVAAYESVRPEPMIAKTAPVTRPLST